MKKKSISRKNKKGKLASEIVDEEVSNDTQPLHKCFEWNDAVAAKRINLIQMGRMKAAINEMKENEDKKRKAKASLDKIDNTLQDKIIESPKMTKYILDKIVNDAKVFKNRLMFWKDYLGQETIDKMDKVIESLTSIKKDS